MPISAAEVFLVEQIQNGDEDAWLRVIDKYQGRLAAFARRKVGDDAAADDIVQEAFIGLLRSISRFDRARSLETYLFSITHHKIVDYLKARGREPAGASMDLLEDREASEVDGPSTVLIAGEKAAREEYVLVQVVTSFIASLKDERRFTELKVVELLFCLGLRNKEAARIVGLNEKSVAGIKFRALKRLQELVREENARTTA